MAVNYNDPDFDQKRQAAIEDLHDFSNQALNKRWEINEALGGVDIEHLISSGLDHETIAAVLGIPVEDISILFQHERDTRATMIRKGRKIYDQFGTYDFIDKYHRTGHSIRSRQSRYSESDEYRQQKAFLNLHRKRKG